MATLTVICFGALLTTGAASVNYAREDRCNFKPSATSLGDTRYVIHDLDIKSGRMEVSCMRGKQEFGRFTFAFAPPPQTLSGGETFDLVASLREHRASADDRSSVNPRVEMVIRPRDAFLAEGFPISTNPLDVSLADLRAIAREKGSEPLSQKVRVLARGADEPSLTCGYVLTLPAGAEEHRFQFLYEYTRPGPVARWLISRREAQARKDSGKEATAAKDPVGSQPWRKPELQRLFAEYIASLNVAIREKRGSEWSVDAWGRELGPDTKAPIIPPGSWETSSHFLWERNPSYDFYPETIRSYLRKRLASGASADQNPPAVP